MQFPFLSRTEMLIGKEALQILRSKKVAVLGIGGVGSYAAEALARCGVGHIVLVDDDRICPSNLNRQLHATRKTVGRYKVEVMRERIEEIDDQIKVDAKQICIMPENTPEILEGSIDYVIDALDTVSAKLAVAEYCVTHRIDIISCMGTGNKLDPTRFIVTDIYKTRICPLARVMRHELRTRGIDALKVVCSEEYPLKPCHEEASLDRSKPPDHDDTAQQNARAKRQTPASISFVPPVAGFILAGEAVKDLIGRGE